MVAVNKLFKCTPYLTIAGLFFHSFQHRAKTFSNPSSSATFEQAIHGTEAIDGYKFGHRLR